MQLRRISALLFNLVVLMGTAVACQPKIGDDCARGTDCSTSGTRTCDTSMPGGYCTVANCEADTCPEEAACIAFTLSPATTEECIGIGESRAQRSFCMRRCSSQDDCRGEYRCIDLNSPKEGWGSQRVDRKSQDGRVCALPYQAERGTAASNADDGAVSLDSAGAGLAPVSYCSATTRDASLLPYYGVGGGSGSGVPGEAGAAGAAGTAGTAAMAGAAGGASEGIANGGAAGLATGNAGSG